MSSQVILNFDCRNIISVKRTTLPTSHRGLCLTPYGPEAASCRAILSRRSPAKTEAPPLGRRRVPLPTSNAPIAFSDFGIPTSDFITPFPFSRIQTPSPLWVLQKNGGSAASTFQPWAILPSTLIFFPCSTDPWAYFPSLRFMFF